MVKRTIPASAVRERLVTSVLWDKPQASSLRLNINALQESSACGAISPALVLSGGLIFASYPHTPRECWVGGIFKAVVAAVADVIAAAVVGGGSRRGGSISSGGSSGRCNVGIVEGAELGIVLWQLFE